MTVMSSSKINEELDKKLGAMKSPSRHWIIGVGVGISLPVLLYIIAYLE